MISVRASLMTIGGIAAISVSACTVGEATVADSEETGSIPLAVETSSPERAVIGARYQATAAIIPDAEAEILARVAGDVVAVLAEEGDRVEAGQVLARLDGERLRLQMLQAQAELEKARRERDRYVSLREQNLVSAASVEELQYQMEALTAAYELTRLNHGYTTIRATIAGVVSSRDVKVGQNMQIGDRAFTITDTTRLVAYLQIPQVELAKFAEGQQAELWVDAIPNEEFSATISRISPTVNQQTGTFRATAEIVDSKGQLVPGMLAQFEVVYEKRDDALLIPASATREEDNETVVYVVNDGLAERRVIRTGIRSNMQVEVLDGLQSDDQVVITGLSGLRDGSRILTTSATDGM